MVHSLNQQGHRVCSFPSTTPESAKSYLIAHTIARLQPSVRGPVIKSRLNWIYICQSEYISIREIGIGDSHLRDDY